MENGKYEYKKETSPKRINLLEVTAFYLVNHLQLSMNHINTNIRPDQYIMNKIVNNLTLEAIGHQATAFSIGVNYHLGCNTDVNMFYTLPTVIAPKDICADDVIYYFIFPTFGIRVPLSPGD